MNHIASSFGTSNLGGLYSYKYNGKELQTETGMYDYGARFYMPDIGRWGVVDPRSQYTHEAYSYVWNNPIGFWDPTGMEGEDPNKIYGPKGGAPIQEVVVTASKPLQTNMAGLSFIGADDAIVATVIIATPIVLVATYYLSKYLTDKILDRAQPIIHQTPYNPYEDENLEPVTQPRSMKTEDNADEDKDVNGQNVPKEKKVPVSGKTGKEAAKDVPSWAKEQGEAPYVDEDGKTFAERLLNGQYGKGEWNKGKASKGPGSEFNKIKKWGDRGFEVKKK